mmetsp:Transcript_2361/g.5108  ORF Transcript_2361/g.5108 Transcript_2361/m.5108 type:complete len:84 (-) Transcript_2361:501-752(-)
MPIQNQHIHKDGFAYTSHVLLTKLSSFIILLMNSLSSPTVYFNSPHISSNTSSFCISNSSRVISLRTEATSLSNSSSIVGSLG